MPKLINSTPSYRRHSSGQAFVQLDGKRCYLGPHGTKTSRREYDRIIGVWLANGRRLPGSASDDTTVAELIVAFWKHAKVYHLPPSGVEGGELSNYRLALRHVRKVAADTPAAQFGPLMLDAVRTSMITGGWSRTYVNAQVGRVKRMFKWGTAKELVAAGVLQALQSVDGLRAGKTSARETEPVRLAPDDQVAAVLATATPTLAAMIRLQQLTGMRPGEVTQMRPADIERTEKLWTYRPAHHKTQHRGHHRVVFLGAQCQAVLAPFLDRAPDASLFSPADADAARRARLAAGRKTPASCGNRAGTNRVARPKRAPGVAYCKDSYHRAITHACDAAFPPPSHLAKLKGESTAKWRARLTDAQRVEFAAWRDEHRWHPNQLRHNFATFARREYGLEAAQVLLGHKTLTVTQVYAERNVAAAQAVMAKVG